MKTTLVLIILLIASFNSLAVEPVPNKEDFKAKADTIVGGEIVAIECHKKIDEMKDGKKVATRNTLKAKLKMTSIDKGNLQGEFWLLFDDSPDANSPKHYVGDKAKYYLMCMGGFCSFAAKNSAEYTARGEKNPAQVPLDFLF